MNNSKIYFNPESVQIIEADAIRFFLFFVFFCFNIIFRVKKVWFLYEQMVNTKCQVFEKDNNKKYVIVVC